MITTGDVSAVLLEVKALAQETTEENVGLVLDSLTLIWLSYLLEERHGLRINLQDEELATLQTVEDLYGYLAMHFPSSVARIRTSGDQ